MADEGRVFEWGESDKGGMAVTLTASALPTGVSYGAVRASIFAVVLVFDDQGVQPTFTIEDGVRVDGIPGSVDLPLETEQAADDEKPSGKPSDAEGESRARE